MAQEPIHCPLVVKLGLCIFTDDEHLIETDNYETPLGKSDHIVLTWNITTEPELRAINYYSEYNYWRGDYDNMMKDLQKVD